MKGKGKGTWKESAMKMEGNERKMKKMTKNGNERKWKEKGKEMEGKCNENGRKRKENEEKWKEHGQKSKKNWLKKRK